MTWAYAGPDPVRAMVDLNRLCLFPAVFTVTPDTEKKLPSNWGQPCVHLVTAAADTLRGVKFQVSNSVPSECMQCFMLDLRPT